MKATSIGLISGLLWANSLLSLEQSALLDLARRGERSRRDGIVERGDEPANLLRRSSWTASTIKPGDEVSIIAYPRRVQRFEHELRA